MSKTPNDGGFFADEDNPYAPPVARLAAPAPVSPADFTRAEVIRRDHIGAEASIKSLGTLHLVGAILAGIGCLAVLIGSLGAGRAPAGLHVALLVAYAFFGCGLNLALGIGLRRLKNWARWTDTIFMILSLLFNLLSLGLARGDGRDAAGRAVGVFLSMLIGGYIIYLLLNKKAAVIFSPAYQDIIAETPHVKYRTGWLVKGCLIVFVLIILLAILAAVFAPRR